MFSPLVTEKLRIDTLSPRSISTVLHEYRKAWPERRLIGNPLSHPVFRFWPPAARIHDLACERTISARIDFSVPPPALYFRASAASKRGTPLARIRSGY